MHYKRAARVISAGMHSHCTACASIARSADVPACPATSTRRQKLSKSFLQAGHVDVQRAVDQEVDLGHASTPELACDAVTSGTLSAGNLGRLCELAHLLFSWCAAESLRELQILRPLSFVPLLLSQVRVFGSEVDGWMTLDERHPTVWLRHAAGRRSGQERYNERDLRLFDASFLRS